MAVPIPPKRPESGDPAAIQPSARLAFASAQSNDMPEECEAVTIRLVGDSADGMQMAGSQLTFTSALGGNLFTTIPEFPAEIRAPVGSLAGVSGYQVHLSSAKNQAPADQLDALVAMNPAALKLNLKDLRPGGALIVNRDAFTTPELRKAGYDADPLDDGSLSGYRTLSVPMTTLNRDSLADIKLTPREADRCKNFFALGLIYWLFEKPLEPTLRWIHVKFATNPAISDANARALHAGFNFGETTEQVPVHGRVKPAALPAGRYRKINGTEATALALVAAAEKSKLSLLFAGHPSVPASEIFQLLVDLKSFGVRAVQTEDEASAVCAAVGAAFAGALGATANSGPGLCLKSEGIGLAVMSELPLVVVNIQRAGPSIGMPTKTEQGDLLQALFGRNGESPVVVLAPATPAECFSLTFEAARIAIGWMTPVIVLSDVQLANSSTSWLVPRAADLPQIPVVRPVAGKKPFLPYKREERGARPWPVPGTPGLEHRTGGLEKEELTGNVSYDPINHERMVEVRASKIANIPVPDLTVEGPEDGELLVLGWGSTYGPIAAAVERAVRRSARVAHAHLRYLNPLPANMNAVLERYQRVLVPELNGGQLSMLLRARYLVDAIGLQKNQGRPFLIGEIETKIDELLHAV